MKATELMIGDWVQDFQEKRPMQVVSIYQVRDKNGVAYHAQALDSSEFIHAYEVAHLDPLPLTAEAAQRNGWELEGVGDHGSCTPDKYVDRFESWMCHDKWHDIRLTYDRVRKEWHLYKLGAAVNIKHVHELQHALRLCGIEKEVVAEVSTTGKTIYDKEGGKQ